MFHIQPWIGISLPKWILAKSRYWPNKHCFTTWYKHLIIFSSSEGKVFALKQIEGTGISMTACREIAVSMWLSVLNVDNEALVWDKNGKGQV